MENGKKSIFDPKEDHKIPTQPTPTEEEIRRSVMPMGGLITEPEQPSTRLPMAYVLWLTWRSKFVDQLCSKDHDLLHQWKAFEQDMKEEVERDYLNAN